MLLFCEYVIQESNRTLFREWAAAHPELWVNAELLENTEQPGVFVEIWRTDGEDQAHRIQKERQEGRSEWRHMEAWVKGGRQGLRLWLFQRVTGNG